MQAEFVKKGKYSALGCEATIFSSKITGEFDAEIYNLQSKITELKVPLKSSGSYVGLEDLQKAAAEAISGACASKTALEADLADRTKIEYDGGLEKILANINPTYSPWGILGEWKLDSFTLPSLPCVENVAEFPAKVEALDPYSS